MTKKYFGIKYSPLTSPKYKPKKSIVFLVITCIVMLTMVTIQTLFKTTPHKFADTLLMLNAIKEKLPSLSSQTVSTTEVPMNVEGYYKDIAIKDITPNGSHVNRTNTTKVILSWYNWLHDLDIPYSEDMFSPCPESDCYMTSDRNYMPLDQFHAVVLPLNHYGTELPSKRGRDQKYVFMSVESRFLTYIDIKTIKNFYNWTMTFRRDSDIHHPYGVVVKKPQNVTLPTREEINKRPKLVAWMVSNCRREANVRKYYVEELSRYIPVDIYGGCGNLSCGIHNHMSGNCMPMVAENYKFYLSFENTHCMDYVTEKLYNPLRRNIVPIVLGGGIDYKSIAPPHSVINTNDFGTPKLLAEYLLKLNSTQNVDEYLKYFEWKKSYSINHPGTYVVCQLCEKLHQPLKYSSYEDIEKWFYGFNKCHF